MSNYEKIRTIRNYRKVMSNRLVTCSESEVKKLFNLLYTDSNFYLNRKFKKFNYYVNTEVSQIITDHCNA